MRINEWNAAFDAVHEADKALDKLTDSVYTSGDERKDIGAIHALIQVAYLRLQKLSLEYLDNFTE